MFSPEQYIDSIKMETNICKHLYSKTTDEMQDFRPTLGQRSILELLQYLTICVQTPMRGLISGAWSHLEEDLKKIVDIEFDGFSDAMDSQVAEVERLLSTIAEDDYVNKMAPLPNGQEVILGASLVNFPLKFLTAYRMQLFLYLKSTGRDELNTMNCWFGMDKPPESTEES